MIGLPATLFRPLDPVLDDAGFAFHGDYFAPSDLTARLSGCFAATSGVHVRVASVYVWTK